MMDTLPATYPEPVVDLPVRDRAVFVEQIRLLYKTPGVIAIGLIVAALSAFTVRNVVTVRLSVTWFSLYFVTVFGQLLLIYYQRQTDDLAATAQRWGWRYLAGVGLAGSMWGAFGCMVLASAGPIEDVFVVFVLGGMAAGSMVSTASYLPAFYGYALPAVVPAITILLTRPDWLRIEMGIMLALFTGVLAVTGHNLNLAIVSESRLRIEQGLLLAKQSILFAKLTKSEALMIEAQTTARLGHWEFDEASNLFTASREVSKIYGVDHVTFRSSLETVAALAHPDDRERFVREFKRSLAEHKDFVIDHRLSLEDGTIKFVRIAGKAFYDSETDQTRSVGTVQDTTDQKEVEAKLLFANTLQAAELEASPDGILVVDENGNTIFYNHRFSTLWNEPWPELLVGDESGRLAHAVSSVKEPEKFLEGVQYYMAHPHQSGEDEIETLDGRFLIRVTAALETAGGEILGRVWFFRDVTARRRAEASVAHSARFDELTGLANRALAVQAIRDCIAQSRDGNKIFAVIYLDLDHFKDINDTLGHPVGDALLCAVAQRLESNTAKTDTVARFGGDEFAVVVANLHEPADAALLADRLVDVLGEPFMIEGNAFHVSASIGIESYGSHAPDAETLLAHADMALYRAKADGRGKYRFFTGAMDDEVRTRVTLGAELRSAIDEEQFFLRYQPQVDIDTGQIVGVEALVRWNHPTRGVLSPALFIPLAERLGIIRKLSHWVLWAACRQAREWMDAGLPEVRMAVNLSVLEFKTPIALENDIFAALAETRLPPSQLELELTETVLMDASSEHNDVLQRLRRRGMTIAIDDFGTGYSSLGYLRQFPCDRIKIAQEFVSGLTSTSESAAIVKATIGLGQALGMVVIAEGVESREQLDLLRAWGCDEVQGYYFSRPIAPEEVVALVANGGTIRGKDTIPDPSEVLLQPKRMSAQRR